MLKLSLKITLQVITGGTNFGAKAEDNKEDIIFY